MNDRSLFFDTNSGSRVTKGDLGVLMAISTPREVIRLAAARGEAGKR